MSAIETTKAALAQVAGELNTLRGQQSEMSQRLGEIDREVSALRAAPINMEDLLGYLPALVAQKADAYSAGFRLGDLVRDNRGTGHDSHEPLWLQPWSRFEDEDGVPQSSAIELSDRSSLLSNSGFFGAMCYFVPEAVIEKMTSEFKRLKWRTQDAMPVAQRRARIAELDQEREQLEGELTAVTATIAEISEVLGA